MKSLVLCFFLVIGLGLTGHTQISVKLNYLGDYVGDSVHVCGKVESARYMAAATDSITLINIGGKYPDQLLTVVIWKSLRGQFAGAPETDWLNKQVCINGKVEMYRGKPQIVVKQASQVQVQE